MELGPWWAPTGWRPARRRLAVATAGATLVGAGVLAAAIALPTSADDAAPASTVQVDQGTVTVAVAATGTVEPAQDRQLGFGVAGTVTRLDVRLGQDVTAGEILAAVDDSDAVAAVEQAQEALAAARQALGVAQAQAADDATDDVGTTCATNALTAWTGADPTAGPQPDPTPSSTPDPTEPTPSGTAPGTVTSPSPSPAVSGPASSASPTATAATGPGTAATDSPQQRSGADTGCGGTDDESSGGAGTGSGAGGDPVLRARQQVTAATLRLASAEDDLTGTVISAPIDGKVLAVAGAIGSAVRAGDTFVELGAVAQMQVTASFPEADSARLAVGQSAVVTLPARPGTEFSARVTQVDPVGSVDGQLVRFGVLVDFDQMPDGLLIGQSAGVRIVVDEVTDAVRIPVTALGRGSGGEDIVVVPAGSEGQRRQVVTVGVRGDQYVEVIDGLVVGDRVLGTPDTTVGSGS
ncbi:efflux RND transporter periplasmic adaptor subunit [Solwaraspora sp. WMMB335]|uniref:efflux RND transporter periplasmic adaptor subunit n=1 Tax=Solwaraspora sp. WMMB335 TaxID=3404118 RepID=UPI003B9229D4